MFKEKYSIIELMYLSLGFMAIFIVYIVYKYFYKAKECIDLGTIKDDVNKDYIKINIKKFKE